MERFRIPLSLARNGKIPYRGYRLARNGEIPRRAIALHGMGETKKLRKMALAEFNL
jgi:hypothetical protein